MSSKRMVLIAISDPVQLATYEGLCSSLGYQVMTAESVQKAQIKMSHTKVQIVISEWNVQHRIGTDFCQSIRQNKVGTYTYFIAVTSQTEELDLAEAVQTQVDEFLSNPITLERLSLSLAQADRVLNLQSSLSQLNETLPEAQRTLERELFLLRQLQVSLQPRDQQLIDNVKIHLYSQPLALLSGDQCAVFKVRPDKVGFIVVDVKQRGIPAAIRAMGFARLFSQNPIESVIFKMRGSGSEPTELRSCDDVLSILNTVYQVADDGLNAISAIYGVFDSKAKSIEISCAGMPLPYLIRRNGVVSQVGMMEPLLGASEHYRYGSTRLSVEEGDLLFLYSDGITQAPNLEGQCLPFELLDKTIRDLAPKGFDALKGGLVQTVLSWSQQPQHHVFSDDVTVLGLDLFHEPGKESSEAIRNISGIELQSSALIAPPELNQPVANQNNLSGFVRKALVVCDDLEPSKHLLVLMRRLGIECVSALAHEGTERFGSGPMDFDLVLIEGNHAFQLTLNWLQFVKQATHQAQPYVIVCHPFEALNFSSDLIEAGAHKLIRFPCAAMELQFHLETASRHIQLQRSVELKAAQVARIRAEMDEEMGVVAQMQLRTLPKRIPELPQLMTKWIYRAAKRVSGDLIGVFQMTPTVVGFFALDGDREGVLGAVKAWAVARLLRGVDPFQNKDSQAADGMSGLKSLNSPAQILAELNQIMVGLPVGYRLDCSMVFGTLDCQTGQGVLSNAGNPPVYISQQKGSFLELGKVSAPLGKSGATRFENMTFHIKPGDRIYVYTDGLIQLLNQSTTEGAMAVSMLQLLEANSFKPANRVKQDLESLIDKVMPRHNPKDISVLMLELEEVREIEMRDLGVIEWIDRYQPLMKGLSGSMLYPLQAKVFAAVLNDFSGPELVAGVSAHLKDQGLYSEDICKRCGLVLNELICRLERKTSNPALKLNLTVVLLMHADEVGLILIDNGRPLSPSTNEALKKTLEAATKLADGFRLLNHLEENQILLILRDHS